MKNMFKMNKKGFTLVELLAVIVILALLIVITANTVLPMMGRSKNAAIVTYAKRVLNNATTNVESDRLTGTPKDYYKIFKDLTEQDDYYGCVMYDSTDNDYSIRIYSTKDQLFFTADNVAVTGISDLSGTPAKYDGNMASESTVEDFENTYCKGAASGDSGKNWTALDATPGVS